MKILSFFLTLLACLGAAVFLSTPSPSETVLASSSNDSELIAGYRKWKRVNAEPQNVPSRIAIQCAAPTVRDTELEQNNPHRDKFVVVYVNDIGRFAMTEQKYPKFPQGSIIVKEKLATKDSDSPELLTVMRKREPGYNPDNGDWEYMVFDGPGKVMQASGKLENCQGCHVKEKITDYVSRRYIPFAVVEKMQ